MGALALGVLAGLAAGAFALGAALGDGPPPRPSLASTLSPAQLAGQRIVVGFSAARPPAAVESMICSGQVAGPRTYPAGPQGRA